MALAVCLLFDGRTQTAIRRLWDRLEEDGIPSLRSHTHGRHVPHLSYAVLRTYDVDKVREVLETLPAADPPTLHFDAVGTFRRGRSWLVPAFTGDLLRRQERVVSAVVDTGADLHLHYRPGYWVPHCTVAPRVRLEKLPALAAAVYDVLPLDAVAPDAALIDSGTGEQWPLDRVI